MSDLAQLLSWYAPRTEFCLRANVVTTSDGFLLDESGSLATLESREDRRRLNLIRQLSDVVLVGGRTAMGPGYRSMAPWPEFAEVGRPPRLAVLSATCAFDSNAAFLTTNPLVLTPATTIPAWLYECAEVITIPVHNWAGPALAALHQRSLTKVVCEGGAFTLAALGPQLDELLWTVAPACGGSLPLPVTLTGWHERHFDEVDGFKFRILTRN